MERMDNYLERNEVKLNVFFSRSDEVRKVKEALAKYDWYKENGYPLTFPAGVDPDNTDTQHTDIESCVEKDFDASVYEKKADEVRAHWEKLSGQFFEKAKSFNLLTQPEYRLYLTRYGVGGSYRLPNYIILNFNYPNYEKIENVMMIVFHEIIHLAIEKWIKENGIDHWTKERLVDLTYNTIFENKAKLQRDPEQSEKIKEVFDTYFPDMKRVIIGLSNKEI